jgi:hypothetical protein
VTVCDFLWAVCGVRGSVCLAVCVHACRGARVVMIAHCTVVAAVRDVVRACSACVFVCCVRVCDMPCVACWRALFRAARGMTLPCRCAGRGLPHRVRLCARVCGGW